MADALAVVGDANGGNDVESAVMGGGPAVGVLAVGQPGKSASARHHGQVTRRIHAKGHIARACHEGAAPSRLVGVVSRPMRYAPRVRSRPRPRSRGIRAMLGILRAMLVIVVIQLSGLPHMAADAFIGDDSCCDGDGADCADEKSGLDCPPGCPTCHCPHGGIASLPGAIGGDVLPPFDASTEILAIDDPTAFIPRPDLPGLYRPPRSRALPT